MSDSQVKEKNIRMKMPADYILFGGHFAIYCNLEYQIKRRIKKYKL